MIKKATCIAFSTLLCLFSCCSVWANQDEVTIEMMPEIKATLTDLVHIVEAKEYKKLNKHVAQNDKIRWINCGPTDGDPFKYSPDYMISKLTQESRNATIYVNGAPTIYDLERRGERFTILLQTEGWAGEYPFYDFSFEYTKHDGHLRWFGTCYDEEPPVNESKHMIRESYRKPKLPRPGPSVFKDASALGARIKEILLFKNFDALKKYAVRNKIIFSECGKSVIVSDELEGEYVVPVDKVLSYLKAHAPQTDLKLQGREDILSEGWRGEHSRLRFVISESKDGWEWNHVVYCK
jgi:hypothetical protein